MKSQLLVSIVLLGVLSGCGRQVTTAAHEEVFMPHTVIKPIVVPMALIHEQPKPVKGVVLDGRVYPAGQVPTITATPAPDAPKAGLGHLHMVLKLANKLSFCERFTLTVTPKGQPGAVFTRSFDKPEFVGRQLEATATNLTPGDYDVTRESYSAVGRVFERDIQPASVEASKTVDVTL